MLQFKLGCQFQGMNIGRCGEMAFFEEGVDRRPNGRGECAPNIFILHGSGRRPGEKKPRRSGAKDALSRPVTLQPKAKPVFNSLSGAAARAAESARCCGAKVASGTEVNGTTVFSGNGAHFTRALQLFFAQERPG